MSNIEIGELNYYTVCYGPVPYGVVKESMCFTLEGIVREGREKKFFEEIRKVCEEYFAGGVCPHVSHGGRPDILFPVETTSEERNQI